MSVRARERFQEATDRDFRQDKHGVSYVSDGFRQRASGLPIYAVNSSSGFFRSRITVVSEVRLIDVQKVQPYRHGSTPGVDAVHEWLLSPKSCGSG